MANLTKKDVNHVAELANLKLTEQEVLKFLPQMSKIIEFVGTLGEVDTDNVLPTSQTTGLTNVLREDIVKVDESLTQEEALSGSSGFNGFFEVDAVLTERTNE